MDWESFGLVMLMIGGLYLFILIATDDVDSDEIHP